MNWRTDLLLTVSIQDAANLSCCGPETGTASLEDRSRVGHIEPTQDSPDMESPKSEVKGKLVESNRGSTSRVEKTRYDKELIALTGLAASFL